MLGILNAYLVPGVFVGTFFDQKRHHIYVPFEARPMQRPKMVLRVEMRQNINIKVDASEKARRPPDVKV